MRGPAILLWLLIVMFGGLQSGLWEAAEAALSGCATPCAADCPGDEDGGDCPDGCQACACCPTARIAQVPGGGVSVRVRPAVRCAVVFPAPDAAPSGVQRRVFRPPRRLA